MMLLGKRSLRHTPRVGDGSATAGHSSPRRSVECVVVSSPEGHPDHCSLCRKRAGLPVEFPPVVYEKPKARSKGEPCKCIHCDAVKVDSEAMPVFGTALRRCLASRE